ncbi:uncharacterized protein V6R79_007146 [Siganus canaliculatus]
MLEVETYKNSPSSLPMPICSKACNKSDKSKRAAVMDKNPVTRTFSIGAICNGSKSSNDFSTSRRHSSAGIRALLWATSSAKPFGCSLGSDSQTSRESIFPNILTPDSIPQFTIPSLSVQTSLRSLDRDAEEDHAEGSCGMEQESSKHSSSTSSLSFSLALSDRKAGRSVSDPFTQRRSLLQKQVSHTCSHLDAQHCLDPASRAALSLPHLTKVTTPYGFVTLSQSPQMASEEALLCQAGLRRLNKDEESSRCINGAPGMRTVDSKGSSSHLSGDRRRPSKDSAESQTKGSAKGERKAASASSDNATVSPSSVARHPDGKRKRFCELIRRHFTFRC